MKINRLLVLLAILILLAIIAFFYPYFTGEIISDKSLSYTKEPAFVLKVIDGDTIETDKGIVRLLGINTPEKNKPYYNDAKNFLKIIENHRIDILRDKTDKDKYNRSLRYIFYNNSTINVEILEKGFATSFMIKDLYYEEKLRNAENFARQNKLILWQESNNVCKPCIELIKLNYTEEYFVIRNICDFKCNLSSWSVKDDANHIFKLKDIDILEVQSYSSEIDVWNNDNDRFFMRDSEGKLVIFYEYNNVG